jgi:hypothetical protein
VSSNDPSKIIEISHENGVATKETSQWIKSYELDGKEVKMIIRGGSSRLINNLNEDWCNNSFFKESNSWSPVLTQYFKFEDLPTCEFPKTSDTPWCPINSNMETDNVPAMNLPCKMNHGLGLFSNIATSDPKAEDFSCGLTGSNTTNCLIHIGDGRANIQNSTYYDQLCKTLGFSFVPPAECSNVRSNGKPCSIYFKILDRLYNDNKGGYIIEFVQGVRGEGGGGAITKFVGLVQLLLCNVSSGIYKGLVTDNPEFLRYIQVLLLLYIIMLGLTSLMGFSQLTHQDLLIRALKIGLITQLISPTSWEFFNTYFFKLFTDGIGELTGIIFGKTGDVAPVRITASWITESKSCNFQNLAGFSVFDSIINEVFSYETTRKILSLLVWEIYGFIYIATIYICFGVVLLVVVKSILVYLVSFLVISILIALAPIFIPFILFETTRGFFENWIKALISYFIQPLIILTFAFFLLQIFLAQLHSMVGYRVCWKHFFTIPIINIKVFAWQYDFDDKDKCIITPNSILSYDTKEPVETPEDQLKFIGDLKIETSPGRNPCGLLASSGNLCTPYNCSQTRYPGYPYLDTNFPQDKDRISELQNKSPDNGRAAPILISLKGMVVFILIIWFMNHFSKMVPKIAKQVAGSKGSVNLSGVAGSLQSSMFKYGASAASAALSPMYRTLTGGRSLGDDLKVARHGLRGLKERAQDAMGGRIDKAKSAIGKTAPARLTKAFIAPHKEFGKFLMKVGDPRKDLKKPNGIPQDKLTPQYKPVPQAQNAREAVKDNKMSPLQRAGIELTNLQKADRALTALHGEKAAKLYAEADKEGNTKATLQLARMHERGYGVDKDMDKAKKLYEKAAKNGDKEAAEELEKLNKQIEKLEEARALTKGENTGSENLLSSDLYSETDSGVPAEDKLFSSARNRRDKPQMGTLENKLFDSEEDTIFGALDLDVGNSKKSQHLSELTAEEKTKSKDSKKDLFGDLDAESIEKLELDAKVKQDAEEFREKSKEAQDNRLILDNKRFFEGYQVNLGEADIEKLQEAKARQEARQAKAEAKAAELEAQAQQKKVQNNSDPLKEKPEDDKNS